MPKISIIVPVYNVEKYIRRCIDSILTQTFTDFELIIVDDGSPDNCGKICEEYAKKNNRVYVIHQENGGLSAARNSGIEWAFANSDSEWITFIDSDDWVHKQYLEILIKEAEINDSQVSCCKFVSVNRYVSDAPVDSYIVKTGALKKLSKITIEGENLNTCIACSKLYRKSLFKSIRYPAGKYHEDEYVTYKVLFACRRISNVNAALYYYFQNHDGITHTSLSLKRMTDRFDAFGEKLEFYRKNKLKKLFKSSFIAYLYLLEKYTKSYMNIDCYKKEIEARREVLDELARKYFHYLPFYVKIYGCNQNALNKCAKIEYLKNDFYCVKRAKGSIYALFWSIKSFFVKTNNKKNTH